MKTVKPSDRNGHPNLYVPVNWQSVSGLEKTSSSSDEVHQFVALNYDVLVDSPIETGVNEHHQFTVESRDYELVIWGEGNYDSAKIVADLTTLVQQSKHIPTLKVYIHNIAPIILIHHLIQNNPERELIKPIEIKSEPSLESNLKGETK